MARSGPKRLLLVLAWIGIGLGALLAVPLVFWYGILDWNGRPVCHKGIDLALSNWQDVNKTKVFPNVDGRSVESLRVIRGCFGAATLETTYRYVPGLARGDPGDLVLLYLPEPTRWTWHGQPPTRFREKAWILVPLDMKFYGPTREDAGPGEFSERVSLAELKWRLEATLEFLQSNERPNWEAVVEEHRQFMKQVEDNEAER
jgi:hypothetical protein